VLYPAIEITAWLWPKLVGECFFIGRILSTFLSWSSATLYDRFYSSFVDSRSSAKGHLFMGETKKGVDFAKNQLLFWMILVPFSIF